MNPTCQDRDLLCLEPVVYLHGGVPGQTLATATDGVLTGVTFTSPSSDFLSAGVAPGMVLCVTQSTPAEGSVLEIVEVQSAVALTVSILRESPDSPPVAPLPATGLTFHVRTFAAQISRSAAELAECLRRTEEATESQVPTFADSAQLRDAVAHGALADVFVIPGRSPSTAAPRLGQSTTPNRSRPWRWRTVPPRSSSRCRTFPARCT